MGLPASTIDVFSDAVLASPYAAYRTFRDQGAAVWLDPVQACFVGRYADVRRALNDWQVFSSAQGIGFNPELQFPLTIAQYADRELVVLLFSRNALHGHVIVLVAHIADLAAGHVEFAFGAHLVVAQFVNDGDGKFQVHGLPCGVQEGCAVSGEAPSLSAERRWPHGADGDQGRVRDSAVGPWPLHCQR